jgi:hypothetical protein
MKVELLEYELVNGFIHNWLVAGPLIKSVLKEKASGKDFLQSFRGVTTDDAVLLGASPVDRDLINVGEHQLTMKYTRCHQDHLVDVSSTFSGECYAHTWMYTQVNLPVAHEVTGVLYATGPVEIWLNKEHIFSLEDSAVDEPVRFPLFLNKGENFLLIRLDAYAVGACTNFIAMRLEDYQSMPHERKVYIHVPTYARRPSRHIRLEKCLEYASIDSVVSYRGRNIMIRWSQKLDDPVHYAYQLQDSKDFIFVEGTWDSTDKNAVDLGHPTRIFERPLRVVLKATGLEYYEQNLRYQRDIPIQVLDVAYSERRYQTLAERQTEALEDASKHENQLFGQIARLRLGRWDDFTPEVVFQAVESVKNDELASPELLVGLQGMLYRFGEDPSFPKEITEAIRTCAINYSYDLSSPDPLRKAIAQSESAQILLYVSQVIAGQKYVDQVFTTSGQKGAWEQQQGEAQALDWLRSKSRYGFQEWNSNQTFANLIVALSHLTSLSQNQLLSELAAVMLDKIFYSMAVNSFRGAFSATHGTTHATMLKSAQMEATSGISRMMWGMGVFNPHIAGTVSMSCADYEFPLLIGNIAVDQAEVWEQEHHCAPPSEGGSSDWHVNTVTYKTADFMLSSAVDYRPGQKGNTEHIWQATFGPEALVFANHPACISENDARQPGFWRGNRILPRVAQWKDVLISIHKLPEDDWMGYTHAYCPIYLFDEYEQKDGWMFLRKEKGYIALQAKQGFELIEVGPDGFKELRSYGNENIWVCHLGREELDGSFEDFKNKLLDLPLTWKDGGVELTSLRSDQLIFNWEDPFTVNSHVVSWSESRHYDGPYCTVDHPATQIDIQHKDLLMRLDFNE